MVQLFEMHIPAIKLSLNPIVSHSLSKLVEILAALYALEWSKTILVMDSKNCSAISSSVFDICFFMKIPYKTSK